MKAEDLKINGRYNWKNQPERLVYLGKVQNHSQCPGWFQFARVNAPNHRWCEVREYDLASFEETKHDPIGPIYWPKHKLGASLHLVLIDSVCRDLPDEQIIEETLGLATPEMIDVYRRSLDSSMEKDLKSQDCAEQQTPQVAPVDELSFVKDSKGLETLTCDLCGAETTDPWHFSTATSRHNHACDSCWTNLSLIPKRLPIAGAASYDYVNGHNDCVEQVRKNFAKLGEKK